MGKPSAKSDVGSYVAEASRVNAKGKEFKNTYGRRQQVFCASMADVFDNQVFKGLAFGFI